MSVFAAKAAPVGSQRNATAIQRRFRPTDDLRHRGSNKRSAMRWTFSVVVVGGPFGRSAPRAPPKARYLYYLPCCRSVQRTACQPKESSAADSILPAAERSRSSPISPILTRPGPNGNLNHCVLGSNRKSPERPAVGGPPAAKAPRLALACRLARLRSVHHNAGCGG
jgi:hypothetical protein